jgi:hypothetical protein
MKIILDESVPQNLRLLIGGGHTVVTAWYLRMVRFEERRLAGSGGSSGFDLFMTADQEMSYQQNLTGRKMALVALSTNNWSFIKAGVGEIKAAIDAATPGGYAEVEIPFE